MLSFFHGLRRKLGVVMLVMACVATAGWVRSVFIEDSLKTRIIGCLNVLESTSGYLEWYCTWDTVQSDRHKEFFFKWDALVLESSPDGANFVQRTGFHFEELNLVLDIRIRRLWMPYWSVVLPLTVLSAYLLLTKPRKLTQTETTEPATVEGA